jgi:hypothetical protein
VKKIDEKRTLYTFLDDRLNLEEEQSYLNRINTQKKISSA